MCARKASMVRPVCRGLCVAACSLLTLAPAPEGRAQGFKAHSLRLTGEIMEVRSADLDGDGRQELLVSSTSHWEGRPERTLHVCRWEGKGSDERPVFREAWKVPLGAVFWDVGPAGGTGDGRHVYFLSLDGLHEVDRFGFAPSLRIEAPVLLSVGQEDEFLWMGFIQDWDGDGREEAMLPLGREVRFYRWNKTAGWTPADSAKILPLVYYNNNRTFGKDMGACQYLSVLLYPVLKAVDLNGDGRKDLLALRNGTGFCHLRGEDGKLDPEPVLWDLEIRSEEELARHRTTLSYRVDDLNRDGCADVVVHKLAMSFADWDSETVVFLGRPEGTRPREMHQRIPSRGLLSGVSLDDLDGDGYADVTVWSVKMGLLPLVEILLRGIVHIRSHTYYGAWPEGFSDKAGSEGDFEVYLDSDRPEFIRGLVPNMDGDFNRDGIKDLVAAKGDSGLAIYLGLPGRKVNAQPWAVLEAPGANYVEPEDLDGNGLCDLYGYQVEKGFSLLHIWLQDPAGKP